MLRIVLDIPANTLTEKEIVGFIKMTFGESRLGAVEEAQT